MRLAPYRLRVILTDSQLPVGRQRVRNAEVRFGQYLRGFQRPEKFTYMGLVATPLDLQGRIGNLIQCHRVSLCGHRFSPPPPCSNSKGSRCLSHVGREGTC